MGIRGEQYVGGRLENYTDEIHVERINRTLDLFFQKFEENRGVAPFEMIAVLEELFDMWN